MLHPRRTAQKLHSHEIAGIHALYLDGNIDETVGLHHGGQDPGALITGRPNLEDPAFPPYNPPKKMTAIRAFRKCFLKGCFDLRAAGTPGAGHLQHGGRTNCSKVTIEETGFPGRPNASFP